MASLVWTSVYLLLLIELAIVIVLVLPLPQSWQHTLLSKPIQRFRIGARLKKPVLYLGIALSLALMESIYHHQRMVHRLNNNETEINDHHLHLHHHRNKERKYKAERNMYLSGFALTLLFVIGRITQLLQQQQEEVVAEAKDSKLSSSVNENPIVTDKKND